MPPDAEQVHTEVEGDRVQARVFGQAEETVLLLHGLNAESRELGLLPDAIAGQGLRVITPDLRGHGASQGRPGIVSRERVLKDLAAWQTWLEEEGGRLTAIGGHSMGGVWSLAAASDPRFEPDAVMALCSPATVRAELSTVEELLYRLGEQIHGAARRVGWRNLTVPYRVGPEHTLDHPEAIARAKQVQLIRPTIPLANVTPLLELDASQWAAGCTCQGLIAAAAGDRVVGRENTRRIYEAYQGPKTWLDLPGPHGCFYDDGTREVASKQVAAWLTEAIDA